MSSKKLSQPSKLKKYRKLYAEAKRRGLVRGDKDARSLVPSSYMKTRLNKLAQFMTPEYKAVKVAPRIARAYRDNPSMVTPMTVGRRVVVRNDPQMITTVRRGLPTRVRCLKDGEHEFVPLPVNISGLDDFVKSVNENPIYNDLICAGEGWAFKVYGDASTQVFFGDPPIEALKALAEYLSYYSLFEVDKEFIDGFELFRTHHTNWDFKEERKFKKKKRRQERYQKYLNNMTPEQRVRFEERKIRRRETRAMMPGYSKEQERDRERKRQMRALETEEQRAARYAKNAEYKRLKRQRAKNEKE